MKKTKILLSVLCVLFTIHTFGQAKWTPLISTFQMQVAVVVIDGGSPVNSTQIEIGAFTNDGCRASSFLFDGTGLYGSYVAFLTVNGVSNESITFRVYNHATNSEYETTHAPLNFANTAIIGFPPSPAFEITLNASPVSASPPAPPGSFTATPGNGQVLLNWTIPPSDGGSPISGYEITYGTTVGYVPTTIPINHVSQINNTIPLLTNGTEYTFEICAVNAHGKSTATGPVTATPTAPVTTYTIGFTTDNVTQNGVTASGDISPSSPQAANTLINITILLSGTPAPIAAGTHTVGLTSVKLGAAITAPGTVTRTVTAGENLNSTPITFSFTFTMPADDVNDLIVTHTFTASPSATVSNETISGTTGTALTSQTAIITLTNETVASGLSGVDASSWFANLPTGMTATASGTSGSTSITITFGGTPTATSSAAFDITIPSYALTGSASIAVTANASAVFDITAPPSATVANVTISGTTGTALTSQTATITLTNETVASGLSGVDASSWFANLPTGMTATASGTSGSTSITITFGGTPTATSSAAFDITIPASALTGPASLAVNANASAVFYITAPSSASVANVTISGTTGTALTSQTATITLTNETVASGLSGVDASIWFANLPAGMTATATGTSGSTSITITFGGTPTATSSVAFDITIPSYALTGGANLAVTTNTSAVFNIIAPTPISGATVTQSPLTYNGGLQTPTFCVSFDGGVTCLSVGTDYTVTVTAQTAAGTYTGTDAATITGIGNYSGTTTAAFTIDKAQVTVTQGSYVVTKVYDGTVSAGTGSGALTNTGLVADGTTVTATPGVYPNANTGTHTISIGLTLSNDDNHELVSNTLTITNASITQATYTGLTTATANVPTTGSTGNTVLLPALPDGAIYDATGTPGSAAISGTPTVSGSTLTFDATAQAVGTTATITIGVTSATNYTNYNVIVTVTWQTVVQENTPTASIDFTNELLINLVAGEDYTIDDGATVTPVTADASGNIPIQAGWMGISIDIIKLGVGTNLASAAQTLAIPARPAAPTATKTDTSGGLTNGELNNVDPTMEFKLSSASGWTAISGTDETGLAAGTYLVRYMATAVDFASAEATLIIAASSAPTTPSAPQNFTAAPGNTQVSLSWLAPASDGGSPITSYEVSSDSAIWVTASSSTGHVFTGLVNGTSYTFHVRAVNAIGAGAVATATATPNTGLTPTVYNINITVVTGGAVTANKNTAVAGETVTLTITPAANHELLSLSVYLSASQGTSVTVSGTGATRTFTMPSGDVTVKAVFVSTSAEARWAAAVNIIEGYSFIISQEDANTIFDLSYHLAELINQLLSETGFVISHNDIFIYEFNFRSALAGDVNNRSGANGYFEFRVTPSNMRTSAYNDGIITATPYGATANDLFVRNISTWVLNSQLHVSGLSPGSPLRLYNLSGTLLYQTTATDNKAIIPLHERGLYILVTDECRIKIVN